MKRAVAAVAWLALAGCGRGPSQADVPLNEFPEVEASLTAATFGEGTDPTQTIATVEGRPITAADVALYLDFFPTLTVEQAVDDLIDIRAAAAVADPTLIDAMTTRGLDARIRGRAIAWARLGVYADVAPPADEQVDEIRRDPRYIAFFGTPELVRASHVLIAPTEDATQADRDEARARLERLRGELLAEGTVDGHALGVARAALGEEFNGRPLNSIADLHLLFPREYSGEPTWDGIAAAVEPFAEAAFAASPGDLVGPIESEFGYHLILVEARIPADMPPPAELDEDIRRWLTRNARMEAYGAQAEALRGATDVRFDREAIELLASDAETRVAAEQERFADQVAGGE